MNRHAVYFPLALLVFPLALGACEAEPSQAQIDNHPLAQVQVPGVDHVNPETGEVVYDTPARQPIPSPAPAAPAAQAPETTTMTMTTMTTTPQTEPNSPVVILENGSIERVDTMVEKAMNDPQGQDILRRGLGASPADPSLPGQKTPAPGQQAMPQAGAAGTAGLAQAQSPSQGASGGAIVGPPGAQGAAFVQPAVPLARGPGFLTQGVQNPGQRLGNQGAQDPRGLAADPRRADRPSQVARQNRDVSGVPANPTQTPVFLNPDGQNAYESGARAPLGQANGITAPQAYESGLGAPLGANDTFSFSQVSDRPFSLTQGFGPDGQGSFGFSQSGFGTTGFGTTQGFGAAGFGGTPGLGTSQVPSTGSLPSQVPRGGAAPARSAAGTPAPAGAGVPSAGAAGVGAGPAGGAGAGAGGAGGGL